MTTNTPSTDRTALSADVAGTGIPGLDEVLGGGFPRNRFYMVDGDPGTGKTTLALRFLMEGRALGETCLYLTLSESREELAETAKSHGWTLDGIEIRELVAGERALEQDQQYSVFDPADVELGDSVRCMLEAAEELKPSRVVIDSLSEIRLLAHNPLRYRRQVYALKQFFAGRNCTVLLLDDRTADDSGDRHLQSIAHGVVRLEQVPGEFGQDRRRVRILKLRAVNFRSGYHDFQIVRGGLEIFPRLAAPQHGTQAERERLPSGNAELDALLMGGLHRGISALFLGPVGTGKSSLAGLYVLAAARRKEKAVLFVFDESRETTIMRNAGLGIDFVAPDVRDYITIRQVDPAQLTPGQFACLVRDTADNGAKLVVIDSLNGYLYAMPGERQLMLQLHEMLSYLSSRGVTTIMTEGQHGIMGSGMRSAADVSYLADAVLLLRYFEAGGQIRKAVSVIKNRTSAHESTIRELRTDTSGIYIGEPLDDFHGILTGVPVFTGQQGALLHGKTAGD